MEPKNTRIVFFVPEWPVSSSAVLHSQVLTTASFLSSHGYNCLFVGCERTQDKALESQYNIKNIYKINACIICGYSEKYGYLSNWFYSYKTYRAALETIRKFGPTHVYTRSHIDSKFGRKIADELGATSVFDVRSVAAEEVALRRGSKSLQYHLVNLLERNEIKKSDRLLCVSNNLKDIIRKETAREATVIPCCFDKNKFYFDTDSRSKIREELRFSSNDIVICYSGGLSKWQKVDEIVELFNKMCRVNSNFKFLFLTSNKAQIETIIERSGLPKINYRTASCLFDEVYRYLSSSDAGIIMRDNVIVNNVASPIKIAEYLGCGLPIIMTKGIGDYGHVICQSGVGVVIDDSPESLRILIEYLEGSFHSDVRERAVQFAHNQMSNEVYLDKFLQIFF